MMKTVMNYLGIVAIVLCLVGGACGMASQEASARTVSASAKRTWIKKRNKAVKQLNKKLSSTNRKLAAEKKHYSKLDF